MLDRSCNNRQRQYLYLSFSHDGGLADYISVFIIFHRSLGICCLPRIDESTLKSQAKLLVAIATPLANVRAKG